MDISYVRFDHPIVDRLIKGGGILESGQIANMRTYLLPKEAKTHTRILGEGRTLCGRSLRHNEQWAWQFINRGTFASELPVGAGTWEYDHCTRCAKSLALSITEQVVIARRKAYQRLR